ncbi:MAG: TatD family hydrolase [Planctomycetota bacterium]|nr:TatD family hydrolase [Planctomycetota bacterium]
MIDTHCHLTFPEFVGSPDGIANAMALAAEHGVDGCITISTTTRNSLECLRVAKAHSRVWCSAGVHPGYSDDGPHEWQLLRVAGADPKCVAWGELGLDNHYPEPAAAVQREVLETQLGHIEAWTREGLAKPVVIHCREAFDDLLPRLAASSLPRDRYVFHCFTGTVEEARRVLEFGAWISFTGVASYRNAPDVQAAVKLVPADRIMIETDAPFLSPEPHRKVRPCQPWMASVTARAVAALRGESWEVFHAQINANVQRFFGVA